MKNFIFVYTRGGTYHFPDREEVMDTWWEISPSTFQVYHKSQGGIAVAMLHALARERLNLFKRLVEETRAERL